jgi:D-alanine-D-alanine ligase
VAWSAEREVSLNSGEACAKALEGQGLRVTCVDVGARHGRGAGDRLRPDVASQLRCMAASARMACVQGILEMMRLPYTHSGVLASALAMHKDAGQGGTWLLRALPVPEGVVVSRASQGRSQAGMCSATTPYVVKPVNEGSSDRRVSSCKTRASTSPRTNSGARTGPCGDWMLAEEFIPWPARS